MYTVKQLSDLAGVSVRTLHYYDEIGLLMRSKTGTNGYRYYDEAALLRLQQILFYREIGLELTPIKDILDHPDFDRLAALRSHRATMQARIDRLGNLVDTIDRTITSLSEGTMMSDKKLFQGFTPEEEAHYTRLARLQYDPQIVDQSIKLWKSYTKVQQDIILAEGNQIYVDLADTLVAGKSAQSAEVQAILPRWQAHLHYFYEPTLEILRGLGETYSADPTFAANFRKIQTDLPEYLTEAITCFVDDLEEAELVRLIAADQAAADAKHTSIRLD